MIKVQAFFRRAAFSATFVGLAFFCGDSHAQQSTDLVSDEALRRALGGTGTVPPVQGRPVQPELEGRRCARGMVRGTCFYDEQGNLVYWIGRFWGTDGPYGGEFTFYYVFQVQQEKYNEWIDEIKRQKELRDSTGADPYPNLSIQYEDSQNAWDLHTRKLTIPGGFAQTGALTKQTLGIPAYKAGARIVALWARLQNDYPTIGKFEDFKMGGDSNQPIFPDGPDLRRIRAKHLWEAFGYALQFDSALGDFPENAQRIEDLPPHFIDRLGRLSDEIEQEIEIAESAEKIDRKNHPNELSEQMRKALGEGQ